MAGTHCIDTHSKWFKDLSRKLNIAETKLEEVLYMYQNSRNTNDIPSESEILSMLEGVNTQYSEESMTVWASRYSLPIELNSRQALENAKVEALKFFPEEAITTFPTVDGTFILRVSKPTNPNAPIIDFTKAKLSNERREGFDNELDAFQKQFFSENYGEIDVKETDQNIEQLARKTIDDYRQEYPNAVEEASKMSLNEAFKILRQLNRKRNASRFQVSKGRKNEFVKRLVDKGVDGAEYMIDEGELVPLLPKECVALLKYMDTLNNKKFEDIVFKWYMNGTINPAEDNYKIEYALGLIESNGLDYRRFNSPMEVINAFPKQNDLVPVEKIDLNSPTFEVYKNCPYLSNPIITEDGEYVVFNVEDSEEAAKYIAENIIAKYYNQTPWCIFKFREEETGNRSGIGFNQGSKNTLNPIGSGVGEGVPKVTWYGQYEWGVYKPSPLGRHIAIDKRGVPMYMNADGSKWHNNDDVTSKGPGSGITYKDNGDGRVQVLEGGVIKKITKGTQRDGEYIEYSEDGKNVTLIENRRGRRLHGKQWNYLTPEVTEYYEMGKHTRTEIKKGAFTVTSTYKNTPYEDEHGHVQYTAEENGITIDKGNSTIEPIDIDNMSIQEASNILILVAENTNSIDSMATRYYRDIEHYTKDQEEMRERQSFFLNMINTLKRYDGTWESVQEILHDLDTGNNFYELPRPIARAFAALKNLPISEYSAEKVIGDTGYKTVAQLFGHTRARLSAQLSSINRAAKIRTGQQLSNINKDKLYISMILTAQQIAENNSPAALEEAVNKIIEKARSKQEEIQEYRNKRNAEKAKRAKKEAEEEKQRNLAEGRPRRIKRLIRSYSISRNAARYLDTVLNDHTSNLDDIFSKVERARRRGTITQEDFNVLSSFITAEANQRETLANTEDNNQVAGPFMFADPRGLTGGNYNTGIPHPHGPVYNAIIDRLVDPNYTLNAADQDIRNALNEGTITPQEAADLREINGNRTEPLPFDLDVDEGEFNILGVSNLKAMAILINVVKQKQDTLPHEYAHHYIGWYRHTKIVQDAVKAFGSEEALVQAIGESFTDRARKAMKKGEAIKARSWWKKICDFIINIFNSDKRKLEYLTDAFITKKALSDYKTLDDSYEYQIIGAKGARRLDIANGEVTKIRNLNIADDLSRKGESVNKIRLSTGWEKGADGKWRYEIPDIHLTKTIKDVLQIIKDHGLVNSGEFKLMELVELDQDYKALITAYPEVLGMTVRFSDFGGNINNRGNFNPITNTLTLNINPIPGNTEERHIREMEESLVHEIQHLIQKAEGFSFGGSSQLAKVSKEYKTKTAKLQGRKNILHSIISTYSEAELDKMQDAYNKVTDETAEEKRRAELDLSILDYIGLTKAEHDEYSNALGNIRTKAIKLKRKLLESSELSEEDKVNIQNEIQKLKEESRTLRPDSFSKEGVEVAKKKAQATLDAIAKKKHEAFPIRNEYYEYFNVIDQMDKIAFGIYERLYGEVEARNVEERHDMTPADRSYFTLESTQTDRNGHVPNSNVVFAENIINGSYKLAEVPTSNKQVSLSKERQEYTDAKEDAESLVSIYTTFKNSLYEELSIADTEEEKAETIKRFNSSHGTDFSLSSGILQSKTLDRYITEAAAFADDVDTHMQKFEKGLTEAIAERDAEEADFTAKAEGDVEHTEQQKEKLNIKTDEIQNRFDLRAIDTNNVELEYAKQPWRDDPTKTKYSVRVYLKGQRNKGYFEIVADTDFANTEFNGEYSIHFKTSTEKYPTEGIDPSTQQERQLLYAQVRRMLPAGALISTWGEITPGGKYALEKLGGKWKQLTTRDIRYKNGNPVKVPVYQKPTIKEMQELDVFLDKQSAIKVQMLNLYKSTRISNAELGEVADNIVFTISNLLTAIQKDPNIALKEFEGKVDIDRIRKADSRAALANAIGVENLINYVKNIYAVGTDKEGRPKYKLIKTAKKAMELYNNWDAVMQLTVSRFNMIEGWSLTKSIVKEIEEQIPSTSDDDFNSNTDADTIREILGDLQEAWQVDSKTISAVHSMTSELKSTLQGMPLLKITGFDAENKPIVEEVKDEFGGTKHQTLGKTTNTLLTWFEGTNSLSEMIAILKEKINTDPWILNFYSKLTDTTGEFSNFQNQFFNSLYRPFNNYGVAKTDSHGVMKSSIVNREKASQKVIQSIKASINIGEHPLFKNGVVESAYNRLEEGRKKLGDYVNATDKDSVMSVSELHNLVGEISTILGFQPVLQDIQKGVKVSDAKDMYKALTEICSILKNGIGKPEVTPFEYKSDWYIGGYLKSFMTPITNVMQETTISSLYDSGKMYQSYVIPSYMTKMMDHLTSSDNAKFTRFINNEYLKYDWFNDKGDLEKGWRHSWLKELVMNPDARKVFMHKTILNMDKKNYMKNMNELEYTILNAVEFFSEGNGAESKNVRQPSWYRVTILSNKPAAEYIRFYSERGANYKEVLINNFLNVFNQELSRIQTVKERNLKRGDRGFIDNWDERGREFVFLDFLNNEVKNNSKLGQLITRKTSGIKEDALSPEELSEMASLAKDAIYNAIQSRINTDLAGFEKSGIMAAVTKKIQGFDKANARDNMEMFLWNDAYAQTMILQLLTTDTAFYKNTDDIQKRIAQVHAPGVRPNVEALYSIKAKVSAGQSVSDGIHRSVMLADFKKVLSSTIANVEAVFDKRIEEADESMKPQWRAMKESAMHAYSNINVTDAQAYCSLSAYRKKAVMFGKWNDLSEEIYTKLLDGSYTFTDLRVAFQPLKPFMYSQNEFNTGVPNSPLKKHKSPFQVKDAEYLLIMADALTRNEKNSQPNLLKVLSEVMEESHLVRDAEGNVVSMRRDGIDTIMFNSAVKVGGSEAIDLSAFTSVDSSNPDRDTAAKVEAAAKVELISKIFNNYDTHEYSEAVHNSDYNDYSIQQEVPEHYRNKTQAHGSQERYIIPSDLLDVDAEGNKVMYEFTEADGTTKSLTRDEFKEEYERTIADNIANDIQLLMSDLHMDENATVAERKAALSRVIQEEIESSSRYGIDLWIASCIDDVTGDFIIPLGDPIQSKRVEQLLNSVIKNRINKQKLPGGPVVQVSTFGTSTELHTRYVDKLGGPHAVCMTEAEFNNSNHEGTYADYIKEHQGGVAYQEVFAPIPNDGTFDKFADENGNIDVAAIEATNPELLYLISNRIPTEDKYSIEVLKIVGFLPREAGEAIILPKDLTSKDGSDFDVDKRYLQRKNIPISRRNRKEIRQRMIPELAAYIAREYGAKGAFSNASKLANEVITGTDVSTRARDLKAAYASKDPAKIKTAKLHQFAYSLFRKYAYEVEFPTSGKAYNDNKIIELTKTVMQHETQAVLAINPQNIDTERKIGYAVECLRRHLGTWDELMQMSPDQLKAKLGSNDNLMYLTTQIQYYKQNQSGSTILGMFAIQKIAHAALEGDGLTVDLEELFEGDENKGDSINIADYTINRDTEFDKSRNEAGEFIGLTFGHHVGIAADTAKETFLDYTNTNSTTLKVFSTLIRSGMPYQSVALFMSSNVISEMLRRVNIASIGRGSSLYREMQTELNSLIKDYGGSIGNLAIEELTQDEILESIELPYDEIPLNTKIKVLNYYQMASSVSNEYESPTYATRFNSIANAVGPLIIDNLMTEYKTEHFSEHIKDKNGDPVDLYTLLSMHPILRQFYRTLNVAREIFGEMPANSTQFRELISVMSNKKQFGGIMDKIMTDRDILNKFSNFYQSYLLIASGAVNERNLESYIVRYPKYFISQGLYSKYPNNLFVQNTKVYTNSKGETFLNTETTGLENTDKDALISGWLDLYYAEEKANAAENQKRKSEGKPPRNAALDLFYYYFFRRGIGYSPETGMGLLPMLLKTAIPKYIETYRRMPGVDSYRVLDMFVRNNADNDSIVPFRSTKAMQGLVIQKSTDGLIVSSTDQDNVKGLKNTSYFKFKYDNSIHLMRRVYSRSGVRFEEVSMLGNDGEYLEISTNDIKTPMSEKVLSTLTPKEPSTDALPKQGEGNNQDGPSREEAEALAEQSRVKEFIKYINTTRSTPEEGLKGWREGWNHPDPAKREANRSFMKTRLRDKMKKVHGIEITEEQVMNKLKELNIC